MAIVSLSTSAFVGTSVNLSVQISSRIEAWKGALGDKGPKLNFRRLHQPGLGLIRDAELHNDPKPKKYGGIQRNDQLMKPATVGVHKEIQTISLPEV